MSNELKRRMTVFLGAVAAGWLFICASVTTAIAQENNATPNDGDEQSVVAPAEESSSGDQKNQPKNFWGLLVSGGPLMIPLALCSIVGLASTVERCISLSRNRVLPPGFVEELREEMKSGTSKGIEYCEKAPRETVIADVLKAGLVKESKGPEQVEQAISEAGTRAADRMKRSLRIIHLIVAVAPLLGLVGTVYGMIEAFRDLATLPKGMNKSDVLAGGIYVALVTTAAGLTIAIPFLGIYHFLNNKVDQLIEGIGLAASDFLDGDDDDAQSADAATANDSDDEEATGEPALAS